MHQRQAGTYGRRFYFGKSNLHLPQVPDELKNAPGIGLVPPEFDDMEGSEVETVQTIRAEHSPR